MTKKSQNHDFGCNGWAIILKSLRMTCIKFYERHSPNFNNFDPLNTQKWAKMTPKVENSHFTVFSR